MRRLDWRLWRYRWWRSIRCLTLRTKGFYSRPVCSDAITPLFGNRAVCELDEGHAGPHRIPSRRLYWDEHVYWFHASR